MWKLAFLSSNISWEINFIVINIQYDILIHAIVIITKEYELGLVEIKQVVIQLHSYRELFLF